MEQDTRNCAAMVQDAFKAVLRGYMIQANIVENKKKHENLKKLYQDLEETEKNLLKRPGKRKLGGKT